jgi:D-cysteine desulfhydrase family pyridoxal phosphate-dependent enzyme
MTMWRSDAMMKLEAMPRVSLGTFPTPLEKMENLTKALNGPRLYIKRDDLTGLGFGGNKVRKLEFLMADAIQQGADVIITSGAVQTNHGRLTVAAAVKLGLKAALIITDNEPASYKGNLLLDHLMGADLHFVPDVPGETPTQKRQRGEDKAREVQERYEKQGHKCYVIPRGGRSPVGTAGYYYATLELYQQIIEQRLKIDAIVTGVGSSSTMSSLLLGSRAFSTGISIVGVSVSRGADECKTRILEEIEKDKAFYGLTHCEFTKDRIVVFDDYIGPGYAKPSRDGLEAVKLLARTEAIFLDQNYTGKAFAGFLDLIRKGYFKKDDSLVFLHTGGGPAVFALDDTHFR